MATTILRFYNVRHVDTYEVNDEDIDAVRALIETGDDASLAQADDLITQRGRYVGTDSGDIDPDNEMLDFDVVDNTTEVSKVTVRFHPQAWQDDNAVAADPEGETEWLVSTGTAADIPGCESDLDFVRDDEFTPEWIRNWQGPFEITVVEEGVPTCAHCGQHLTRSGALLVDVRTGDWWCRANPSNGGDAAPHEETR